MSQAPSAEDVAAWAPMPEPDEVSRFFWDGVREHKLLILRCDQCGKFVHWPRDVCKFCLATHLTPREVSGRAALETWTEPYQSPHPWFQHRVPFILAVVELPEQEDLKLVTNIVDCAADDLRIGMALVVDFVEIAPGLTLPLFKPAATGAGGVA
jgi:hypothetical protein